MSTRHMLKTPCHQSYMLCRRSRARRVAQRARRRTSARACARPAWRTCANSWRSPFRDLRVQNLGFPCTPLTVTPNCCAGGAGRGGRRQHRRVGGHRRGPAPGQQGGHARLPGAFRLPRRLPAPAWAGTLPGVRVPCGMAVILIRVVAQGMELAAGAQRRPLLLG